MSESRIPFRVPGQYNLDGFPMYEDTPEQHIRGLKHYQLHPQDVLVTGFPKSGNIWTFTTVAAIQNADSLSQFTKDGFRDIRGPFEIKRVFDSAQKVRKPTIYLSHLPYSYLPQCIQPLRTKIIHVLRNPKDVSVSFYHYTRMNASWGNYKGTWDTFFEAFMDGKTPYGSWFEYTKTWLKQLDNPNVLFIKYEDFHEDPVQVIDRIASFLGTSLSAESLKEIGKIVTFDSMRENPKLDMKYQIFDENVARFLRRGKVGDWKNYYNEEQSRRMDEAFDALKKETRLEMRFHSNL